MASISKGTQPACRGVCEGVGGGGEEGGYALGLTLLFRVITPSPERLTLTLLLSEKLFTDFRL